MSDYDDEQAGPAVWGDAPQPIAPPLRTFKVILDMLGRADDEVGWADAPAYIDAHSVTCEGDVAKFYTYRPQVIENVPVLVAFCLRVLRPYLDIEDVSEQLAQTSTSMN